MDCCAGWRVVVYMLAAWSPHTPRNHPHMRENRRGPEQGDGHGDHAGLQPPAPGGRGAGDAQRQQRQQQQQQRRRLSRQQQQRGGGEGALVVAVGGGEHGQPSVAAATAAMATAAISGGGGGGDPLTVRMLRDMRAALSAAQIENTSLQLQVGGWVMGEGRSV